MQQHEPVSHDSAGVREDEQNAAVTFDPTLEGTPAEAVAFKAQVFQRYESIQIIPLHFTNFNSTHSI